MTAAMADRSSSSPGRSRRMSRNAACTRCRTSKVRCNPSSISGQPCQRCAKHQLPCVIDPTYRRVTRRSQLDQLAREVQAIKETVDSNNKQPSIQTSPSPSVWSQRVQGTNETSPSSVTTVAARPALSTAPSEHNGGHSENNIIVDDAAVDSTAAPSLPRALDSQPFTGPAIDEHFTLYFRHFHPHFPIISQRDPNKCYDASPFLFWVIVLISSLRQHIHSNPAMIRLLAEHVKHETDATVPKVPQPLPQLQAIILVAAWGLYPGARFINDPAYWLSGVAINSCLLLGFHTGSGRHQDYSHATLAKISPDSEAAVTWAACSILNRRLSVNLGLPYTAPINKATVNMIQDEGGILPAGFRVQLECQVFTERVNKTLGSCLEESNGVPHELVRMFEDEWAAVRARIVTRHTDPVLSLHALFVLLEVQMYYFLSMPTPKIASSTTGNSSTGAENLSPSIEAGILRCYSTASTVITRAVELDETTNFLHYLPHYTVRPIAHAISVIFRVIRSNLPLRHPQIVLPEEAAKVSAHTVTVSRRVSAVEGDVAWRLAQCVKLWEATSAPYLVAAANSLNIATGRDNENNNDRDQTTSAEAGLDYEPILVERFRQRMLAGLGFDSMIRWKNKHGPIQKGPYWPQPQTQNLDMQVGAGEAGGNMGHQQQSFTGTGAPVNSRHQSTATSSWGGPIGFQAAPQDQRRLQSLQQQQQTGLQANINGATVPPGETGPLLPSVGMVDTDSLFGTDWGFLDDFSWGFEMQTS